MFRKPRVSYLSLGDYENAHTRGYSAGLASACDGFHSNNPYLEIDDRLSEEWFIGFSSAERMVTACRKNLFHDGGCCALQKLASPGV